MKFTHFFWNLHILSHDSQPQPKKQKNYILQVVSKDFKVTKCIVHDPSTCFANKI